MGSARRGGVRGAAAEGVGDDVFQVPVEGRAGQGDADREPREAVEGAEDRDGDGFQGPFADLAPALGVRDEFRGQAVAAGRP